MKTWRLDKTKDRRFKQGHPWVFSNEIQGSPKGVEIGEVVKLADSGGDFLSYGFGNPSSLIAFRAISRNPEWDEARWVEIALARASGMRRSMGFGESSHRAVFAEADGLPGLVVDAYCYDKNDWVYVVQAQTAGADKILTQVIEYYKKLGSVITKNTSEMRKMDGLEVQKPVVVHNPKEKNFEDVTVHVQTGSVMFDLNTDLVGGQKTGLFLDQRSNIESLISLISKTEKKELKVLDLCCYVGQWTTAITTFAKSRDISIKATLFDTSKSALERAHHNVKQAGAAVIECITGDVLKDLEKIKNQFDIVICDPPGFISGRKNIPTGRAAYFKLNEQAISKVRPTGLYVSCSCSGLLTEEDFEETLLKSVNRSKRQFLGLTRGTQSPDHPYILGFSEGRYLKSWIGQVL
ncbi:MAG: class I SAM-dependent rRNA methyltransferase [Xanthomonadaceae bacterium]|nr:class I SAM-dependent rRNA methyltransferase [Xanthomonadaceae bacterium]